MEVTSVFQTILNMVVSLSYAIVTLLVSVTTLYLIDHFFYKKIDFIDEIKKGNVAAFAPAPSRSEVMQASYRRSGSGTSESAI